MNDNKTLDYALLIFLVPLVIWALLTSLQTMFKALDHYIYNSYKGKMEYKYCGNCDALSFQCKYSEYKIPELEDDLCLIREYNGHYRKTTYQK